MLCTFWFVVFRNLVLGTFWNFNPAPWGTLFFGNCSGNLLWELLVDVGAWEPSQESDGDFSGFVGFAKIFSVTEDSNLSIPTTDFWLHASKDVSEVMKMRVPALWPKQMSMNRGVFFCSVATAQLRPPLSGSSAVPIELRFWPWCPSPEFLLWLGQREYLKTSEDKNFKSDSFPDDLEVVMFARACHCFKMNSFQDLFTVFARVQESHGLELRWQTFWRVTGFPRPKATFCFLTSCSWRLCWKLHGQ